MIRSIDMRSCGAAALLAMAFASGGNATAYQNTPMIKPAQLSSAERTELADLMAQQMELTLKGMKPAEGQLFPTKVIARFDDEGKMLLVELGRRFVVRPDGDTVSDVAVQDQLNMLLSSLSATITEVNYGGIKYLFDGMDVYHYYPELLPRKKGPTSSQQTLPYPPPYFPPPVYEEDPRMTIPTPPFPPIAYVPPSVAINPGHGLYKLYDAGTLNPKYRWTTQRGAHNGVIEDEITPIYAEELRRWFTARSPSLDTFSTRSTSSEVHAQSTQESGITHLWPDMGAKYHVEQLYPVTNGSLGRHLEDQQRSGSVKGHQLTRAVRR